MTRITIIPGAANDGTNLTAVYAENTAPMWLSLIFPGHASPFVHWGGPPHPKPSCTCMTRSTATRVGG